MTRVKCPYGDEYKQIHQDTGLNIRPPCNACLKQQQCLEEVHRDVLAGRGPYERIMNERRQHREEYKRKYGRYPDSVYE